MVLVFLFSEGATHEHVSGATWIWSLVQAISHHGSVATTDHIVLTGCNRDRYALAIGHGGRSSYALNQLSRELKGLGMYNFIRMAGENVVDRVAPRRAMVAMIAMAASFQLLACGAAMDPESTEGQSDEAKVSSTSQALSPTADASPLGCPGTKVALRPYKHSSLYCGSTFLSSGDMGCTDSKMRDWDTFTVYRVLDGENDTGKIALQENYGHRYVSAENGGGGGIHANRSWVGVWELFRPEQQQGANGLYSLSTYNGPFYVTAENGGGSVMNANRPGVGDWEKFYVYCAG